jgi:hypothetical protein
MLDDLVPVGWRNSPNAGMGAAYGTAKSGIGIAGVGTYRPDLIMKAGQTAL